MGEYAKGFAQGERDCFLDRFLGHRLERRPPAVTDPYLQGYWDGYTPRSEKWRQGSDGGTDAQSSES